MHKFCFLFLFFVSTSLFAQSYKDSINKHREQYRNDFLTHQRSPLKAADLKNLRFFKADANYCITATVELLKDEKAIKIPTSSGVPKVYYRYAKAKFTLNGKDLVLTLFKSEALSKDPVYADYLFLPFTDETNHKRTYGGGRYLDIKRSAIQNGQLVIDFNKAYNPYCAYSDGYACPVPPQENDLPIKISAGEKKYTGKVKH